VSAEQATLQALRAAVANARATIVERREETEPVT